MTEMETGETQANILCKACGLCCTGHLFSWTKLRSAELDVIEALGIAVLRSIPSQRGFNQPCPLWKGQCTIYESPSYPHFCHTYKCSLLKKVLDETTPLPEALRLIQNVKAMIHDIEAILPESANPNFRDRLSAHLEDTENLKEADREAGLGFQQQAKELLVCYREVFGVKDIIETLPDL